MGFQASIVCLLCVVLLTTTQDAFADVDMFASVMSYKNGSKVTVTVDSFRTRRGLVSIDPFRLPFCRPDGENRRDQENLGEILLGNRLYSSSYIFTVGKDEQCRRLCEAEFSSFDLSRAVRMIVNKYRGRMFLDGLPVLSKLPLSNSVSMGYTMGSIVGDNTHINNHLAFTIKYVRSDGNADEEYHITGFSVVASSYEMVERCSETEFAPGSDRFVLPRLSTTKKTIPFTYSVNWELDKSGTKWVNRFDIYDRVFARRSTMRRGHWMTAINSFLLAGLLGVVVAFVLARTVRRDLLAYGDDELLGEMREESGWKLIRGDVFRAPPHCLLLTALASAGSQLMLMFGGTVLAAGLGILHPSHRGSLLTSLIFFFLLVSSAAGYVAARMLKFFQEESWANGLTAVLLFPISIGSGYMLMNFIHMTQRSSSAIPFTTLLLLLMAWIFCSIPLALCGLAAGFHAESISIPCKISAIPRLIPEEARGKSIIFAIVGGLVPFCACYIELVYVMGSFWQGQSFYKMGLLAAFALLVCALCAEVAIVVTYITLTFEDYRWWWRSFFSVGSSGVFVFLYSLYYLMAYLEVRLFTSMVLFVGYMTGFSVICGIITGTVGFLASAVFVRGIYGAVKAD